MNKEDIQNIIKESNKDLKEYIDKKFEKIRTNDLAHIEENITKKMEKLIDEKLSGFMEEIEAHFQNLQNTLLNKK